MILTNLFAGNRTFAAIFGFVVLPKSLYSSWRAAKCSEVVSDHTSARPYGRWPWTSTACW